MRKGIFLLGFALLVSFSCPAAKKDVDVPINVGAGPAFFWIPGVFDNRFGALHPGAQLNLYAVITPQVLKENENMIPKKYKNLVNMDEEMRIIFIWMYLIPKYFIISPGVIEHSMDKLDVYGAMWTIFNLEYPIARTKIFQSGIQAVLPTATYLYANISSSNAGRDKEQEKYDAQHLFGVGGMLRLENTIRFSDNFLATLSYGHNFNIPLETNAYTRFNSYSGKKSEHKWIHNGILSLVFNFRFNTKQSI